MNDVMVMVMVIAVPYTETYNFIAQLKLAKHFLINTPD